MIYRFEFQLGGGMGLEMFREVKQVGMVIRVRGREWD